MLPNTPINRITPLTTWAEKADVGRGAEAMVDSPHAGQVSGQRQWFPPRRDLKPVWQRVARRQGVNARLHTGERGGFLRSADGGEHGVDAGGNLFHVLFDKIGRA